MFNLSDFKFSDLKTTHPSKNALKLVIGFDTVKRSVRFWRTLSLNFADADVKEFPYTQHFLSDDFLEEFKEICAKYIAELPTNKQIACYLVLPDSMVMMDNVSLPQMKKEKLNIGLTSHLQNLYRGYKDLQFNSYVAASNKQYITYFLSIIKKKYLTDLYRAMAENKLYSKGTTFCGNCLINAVLHFRPAFRKKSFLFLDLHTTLTRVAVCVKGRTAGFFTLLLGTAQLSEEKVLQESMQYDHDVADLAILNAREKAKAKQLTISATDEEALAAVADDVMMQLAAGTKPEEEALSQQNFQSTVEEMAQTAEEREIAEQFDAEDAAEAEAERQAQLMAQIAEARKKKIFARKMPKRLPKFMLRPEPSDAEGIVYENFRMFVKWALLFYKELKKKEYMPDFDCVLVNLPEKFSFAVARANEGEERSVLPFEYFGDVAEEAVKGNLEMVGALYSGVYNKRENF